MLLAFGAALGLLRLWRSLLGPRTELSVRHGGVSVALSLSFLLSGVAALVYQVVWQRLLALHSGVGIYSVAMIVAAFMAGLGLGSYLGGRLSLRLSERRALLAFVALELLLALFGALSSWAYYDLPRRFSPPESLLATAIGHLAALILPTALMGMSLPFLARAVVLDPRRAGRQLGGLYALNLLGASLGALLAPWVLMRLYGLRGATFAAAAANLGAALLAGLALARAARSHEAGVVARPEQASARAAPTPLGQWLPLYALSGFCALALEIVWFRLFDVGARATAFSFGTVLALYLLGSSLGSLAGARLAPRLAAPLPAFLAVQSAMLLYAALGPLLLSALPAGTPGFATLDEYWTSGTVFRFDRRLDWGLLLTLYGGFPLALYGPPTFLMGLSFPILQRAVQDQAATSGFKAGLLQSANILGCVAGSLLAGLAGLHLLGTSGTLRLLLVVGAAFPLLGLRHGSRRTFGLAALALLAAALALPGGERLWPRLHGIEPGERVMVGEDASGVVLLNGARPGRWHVWTNGHIHSGLPYGGVHTLLGALPVLAHPRPEAVAVVGLGSGDTAWAASLRPETRRIDVFEICGPQPPLLARLAARELLPDLQRLLGDPRLEIHVTDGRQALARSPGRYDVVEMDPLWPTHAYAGNLYSREFYELAARSLKPGGILCSWAPTRRVKATIQQVFPHVQLTRRGDVLLGSLQPFPAGAAPAATLADARAYLGAQRGSLVVEELAALTGLEGKPARRANHDLFPRDELALGPLRARLPVR